MKLRTLKLGLIVGGLASFLAAGTSAAEGSMSYKIIDGAIPAALTAKPGDSENGRKVLINRKQGNCLACHAVASLANQPFHGEVGPSLDGVSKRYTEGQIRLILVNSKKIFDGTIMPAFYSTEGLNRVNKKFAGKTILTAQQVEDVLSFLKTQ